MTTTTPIANMDNLHLALIETTNLLGAILGTAAMDESTEARDLMEVFQDYDWLPAQDADKARFDVLLEKANAGQANNADLREFALMLATDSDQHPFTLIVRAQAALAKHLPITRTALTANTDHAQPPVTDHAQPPVTDQISERQIDDLTHSLATSLAAQGVSLDSDLLCDLNDTLSDFLTDKCGIDIADNV